MPSGEGGTRRTGSPFVRVLEGEGQAVVDRRDLDAGGGALLRPLRILQRGTEDQIIVVTDRSSNTAPRKPEQR